MRDGAGRGFPDLRVDVGELAAGVRFGISSREAGASSGPFAQGNLADHVGDDPDAVDGNRGMLAEVMGAERGLAFIGAVHGADVATVDAPGTYSGVDALITGTSGLGIVALGGDCAIVGVGARVAGVGPLAGVVHCGWRGLVADAIGALVSQMRALGGSDLRAIIGPTICGGCYHVEEERWLDVVRACSPAVAGSAGGELVAQGRRELDIGAAVKARLRELDVHVVSETGCTAEGERWFSHRGTLLRSGAHARTGRHGLCVVID